MDFGLVIALLLVMIGIFRLWLIRSGKLPLAFGAQRYFPYVFIVIGIVLAVSALMD